MRSKLFTMSETPGYTYSPEGLLTIAVTLENDGYRQKQLEIIERLDEQEGIAADGVTSIKVDVKKAFKHDFGYGRGGDIDTFVETIGNLIPYMPADRHDLISHPQWVSSSGLVATVYPNFQRWLNTQKPLNEEVSQEVMNAMALPFGTKVQKEAKKHFRMRGEQNSNALHFDFGIVPEEFTIRRTQKYDTYHLEQEGKVNWTWLNISTLGSCACLGPTGDERTGVDVGSNRVRPWLYEMTSHNIDFAKQTLSLLMGVGVLTYKAALHEAQDDILADATWNEGRKYDLA